ncbi:hypothetical protein HA402_012370 [Bradysia odoriphaga]|nr:hypothetical protein HA402_012370 [Bradysia odoriphaga]
MSFLLECRKINGINIPLYFKFSTILAKENLSADKLLTLENWMKIFDELNPLLASDPSTLRKSKTFEIDSGRLSVKARWAKITDSSDVGAHIVKILNLSSSGVGKYFLKIDVKLSSYLERIASELEQKSKSLDIKDTPKEEKGRDRLNTSKHKKSNNRKISDMLPKIRIEKDDPPAVLDETAILNNLEEPNADDLNKVEEYIPLPKPTASDTSFTTTDTVPTYTPEKCVPSEMNAFHSEYSPTSLQAVKSPHEGVLYEPIASTSPITATYNPEKKLSQIEQIKVESEYLPTNRLDTPIKEELVYKPTSKRNKSSDNERTTKILNKSKELFGSSDEASDDEIDKVSSSSQKSKRKMDWSPRREKRKGKEREKTKSKKKKVHDEVKQECKTEDGDISIRNLMMEPVDAILETYSEHEPYLTGLYKTYIKELKRSYRPIDFPDMLALDIVSAPQFTAMINFLEKTLVHDAEEEHNYSDIIFDLLIPEWALAIFCKRFDFSRSEALERFRLQTVALSNSSQL